MRFDAQGIVDEMHLMKSNLRSMRVYRFDCKESLPQLRLRRTSSLLRREPWVILRTLKEKTISYDGELTGVYDGTLRV